MDVSDVKNAASFVLVRLGVGALVSSAVVLGGVYFIVDNALRGLENSVDGVRSQIEMQSASLNTRIDDLSKSLNEKIDLKFELLSEKLDNQFSETRKEIKKADASTGRTGALNYAGIEVLKNPYIEGMTITDYGGFEIVLNPAAESLNSITMADPVFASWALDSKNSDELKKLKMNGLVVQAIDTKTGPEVTWVDASFGAQSTLDSISRMKGCLAVYGVTAGKAVVAPVSKTATVGKDGIFCKTMAGE
jgi:hypothetical protein